MTEEQREKEWWNQPDKPKEPEPTIEELMGQIERMKLAYQGIPKILFFKQFVALVYVVVNAVFMYVSVNSSSAVYIALYMIPLIILLLDYFLIVGKLKKIARGS